MNSNVSLKKAQTNWSGIMEQKHENALEIMLGEFDPGSERTLAAWIRHASRTVQQCTVAQG